MMRTIVFAIAIVAIAAANEDTFVVSGTGADLVELPAFAMLGGKSHLAYLQAKSFAVKNTAAALFQAANNRCTQARQAGFQSCARAFCECQGAQECSKLDLAVFLETPEFALSQTAGDCSHKSVHAACQQRVTEAFTQCRAAFMGTKRPTHEMLMQVKDTESFVKLAGQFSLDGHSHVFERDSFMQVATYGSGAGTVVTTSYASGGMGPDPSKEEVAEEQDKTVTEEFRAMQKSKQKVLGDEDDIEDNEDLAKHAKEMEFSKLDLAITKCNKLKSDTFVHCEKMMCKYHDKCGTKGNVKQCTEDEKLRNIEKKHQENKFKLARRVAAMKETHSKELKVKGPELKAKALAKEKKYKANAPERAAKKVEAKEIDEKAKKMVDGWVPGGFKLDKKNPFKITTQRKGDRRLLQTNDDGHVADASAEIAKLKKEKDAEDAAIAAAKKRKNSPACKAMASTAFDTCQAITMSAYDACHAELDAADSTFVASLKAAEDAKKAAEKVAAEPPAEVKADAKSLPAPAKAAEQAKKAAVEAKASFTSAGQEAAKTLEEVPTPPGEAAPVPEVAEDKAKEHENSQSAANDLAASQDQTNTGDYPAATKAAKKAEAAAAANVAETKKTASDDLKAADKEAGKNGNELYQQMTELYQSELEEDSFEEDEDLE